MNVSTTSCLGNFLALVKRQEETADVGRFVFGCLTDRAATGRDARCGTGRVAFEVSAGRQPRIVRQDVQEVGRNLLVADQDLLDRFAQQFAEGRGRRRASFSDAAAAACGSRFNQKGNVQSKNNDTQPFFANVDCFVLSVRFRNMLFEFI